jgi:carbamoyl-phosphate synthase large subunit
MRSTGEVLGMADTFGMAFYKAEEATQAKLPVSGTVLISLAQKNRQALEVGRAFIRLGFNIKATAGTHRFFLENGIAAERIHKEQEGRPNITDGIKNREIHLVVNTPIGKRSQVDDSYIRKAAISYKLPYITTLAAALATVKGIAAQKQGKSSVKSLQAYHAALAGNG